MEGNGLDLQKLFAMQAQLKEQSKPLTDVVQEIIQVKYIQRDGSIDVRPLRLYMPEKVKKPVPLVFVPHYEMKEDSLEIRDYLLKGWAVASCMDFKGEYNSTLTYDDLVFNNASLYMLKRHRDIDIDRIAVVGGSAGGYMAMMLSALQLGICCTVANGPVCNLYFNFYKYFEEANRYNLAAIANMSEEERKNPIVLLSKLPLPFVGAICAGGGFTDALKAVVPNPEDMTAWEAISPTGLAECYSNPVYINHATSDILVPIDQLTHKYTYDVLGKTMPKGYNYKLCKAEGKLGHAFCDLLDQSELNLFKVAPADGDAVVPFSFDPAKMFNVCICDEGAPEAYASHNLGTHTGRYSDINYLTYMFEQTALKTNILTPGKLALFAERYQGNARQLVGHTGINDSVYGSLAVYRKEICEQISKWKKDNGAHKFKVLLSETVEQYPAYKNTLQEIGHAIV